MTASLIDLVGYCAAVLTTVSFVPQVWLTLRSRDVSGISLGMYSLFTAGIAGATPLPRWSTIRVPAAPGRRCRPSSTASCKRREDAKRRRDDLFPDLIGYLCLTTLFPANLRQEVAADRRV